MIHITTFLLTFRASFDEIYVKRVFISLLLITSVSFLYGDRVVKRNKSPLSDDKGYKMELFKIECYNFTKTIRMGVCKIIAKRGIGGLLNLVLHYKGVTDFKVNVKLFYRGTSGRYQPFLVDVVMDFCDLLQYQTQNKLLSLTLKVFDDYDPNLHNGCPLVGPLNFSLLDINKLIGPILPPVVPGELFFINKTK